jgi:transcriptional accessory protein Tex/SPT6
MASTVSIDLRHVVRGLGIPLPQVQAVVELLDDGNTVPFIARYRKDRTGGLDEEQIRDIQSRLVKTRFLAERKQTILRSIEAQGKLTEKLAKQIESASTTKRLEDLYLPYKPKKQTLATLARVRGLEPLAMEILDADPAAVDLDARAADFVNSDKKVANLADALLGAGHILAEQISERAELRQRLREILQRSGKLVSVHIEQETAGGPSDSSAEDAASEPPEPVAICQPIEQVVACPEPLAAEAAVEQGLATDAQLAVAEPIAEAPATESELAGAPAAEPVSAVECGAVACESAAGMGQSATEDEAVTRDFAPDAATELPGHVADDALSAAAEIETAGSPECVLPAAPAEPAAEASGNGVVAMHLEPQVILAAAAGLPAPPVAATGGKSSGRAPKSAKAERKNSKAEQKKKKEEQKRRAFADYFDYQEEIKKIPPHRILALNRGERARVLRVRLESDIEAMHQAIDELVVPEGHPHADFLRGCARDSLLRLILPSLERDVRRELTERSETHAVGVFARNLRNLLLQPPIHDRRVLALDPGFKSGCKLAALDQFGNMLEHGLIYLVGKDARRQEAAQKVIDMIARHQLQVVVIGNGTACREAEDFIAGLIGNQLAGQGLAYVIVNEAGASVYSASRIGREEFPHYDASLRGAISIGRRLLDPLSELVKIDPANIGVGLYQHDVKAKHLSASLDEVVESCVNFVGVDANTASPALLRYVSGMNQLTARKVFEHRRQHGPFKTRQQLKEVPGIGEGTFVQATGFLKVAGGDNPLDATWIHPESYEVATQILAKFGYAVADLCDKEKLAALAQRTAQVDLEQMAKELEVGILTLKDILSQLVRPGRDPREDLPAPLFKQGVLKLEDLNPGMELTGTILNVVDFGAFVDIGVHHSGLIHVSQLADKYIRDPHDMVAVGDAVKVWVLEVDKERRRVSLTMIPPGTPRTHGQPGRSEDSSGQRPSDRRGATDQRGPADQSSAGGRGPGYRPPRRPQAAGEGREQGQRTQGQAPPSGAGPGRGGQGQRPPQGRRPRPQGRPPYRSEGGSPPRPPMESKPRPKKPLPPISDEMKAGKAPLRSFGDLLQFFELKHDAPDGSPPAAPPVPPTAAADSKQSAQQPVAAAPPVAQETPVAMEPPAAQEKSAAVEPSGAQEKPAAVEKNDEPAVGPS